MFGEKYMLGTSKHKLDNKGRVIIPSDTRVEENDELIIINKDEFLEVWLLETQINQLKELEIKKLNSSSIEELRRYQDMINIVTCNVIKTAIMDKQKRLNLSKEAIKLLDTDEVVIERMGNHIRIWPDETFNIYREENNKRVKKLSLTKECLD